MHEPQLAQAVLPAATTVFCLRLRPYSLGHELLLIHNRNPLVCGGEIQPAHIAECALICSQTWAQNTSEGRDRFGRFKSWLWNVKIGKCNYATEAAKAKAYIADGQLEFKIKDVFDPDRKTGRPPGAPFLLRVNDFLIDRLRLTESQAWDYPLGLAKMRWETYLEQEGAVEVYNYNDLEYDRFVAEEEAKASCQASSQ